MLAFPDVSPWPAYKYPLYASMERIELMPVEGKLEFVHDALEEIPVDPMVSDPFTVSEAAVIALAYRLVVVTTLLVTFVAFNPPMVKFVAVPLVAKKFVVVAFVIVAFVAMMPFAVNEAI